MEAGIDEGYGDIKPKEIATDNMNSFKDESYMLSKLEIDKINKVFDKLDDYSFDISYNIQSCKGRINKIQKGTELSSKLKNNKGYIDKYI